MELKYHSFWEKCEIWKKSIFEHFFRTRKSKNSVFWGFSENHDFRPKTILLRSYIGCKMIFFGEINFQTFLFLKNLQNGFFTFLISSFNQKLHRETYTQFLDFHDFFQHFLNDSLRKCWRKSWKSKIWVYVSNFNLWLKEAIRNVKNPICRFLKIKKSWKINFTKKLILQPIFELKSMVLGRKSWYSENP